MKISRLAFLSLALPLALAAQPPQGGPPTEPITTIFRTRTTNLERNIAQAFDSIPERLFGYKPTPAQLTIGYIAQHVTSDNYLFCNQFGVMKANLPEKDTATPDSVRANWPRDTLITKLKASFAFCQSAFAQLNDAAMSEIVTLTFGGNSRQVPRINMVLGHTIDVADHYSQLANYMRLNGMLPPSALPRPPRP